MSSARTRPAEVAAPARSRAVIGFGPAEAGQAQNQVIIMSRNEKLQDLAALLIVRAVDLAGAQIWGQPLGSWSALFALHRTSQSGLSDSHPPAGELGAGPQRKPAPDNNNNKEEEDKMDRTRSSGGRLAEPSSRRSREARRRRCWWPLDSCRLIPWAQNMRRGARGRARPCNLGRDLVSRQLVGL